MTEQVTHLDTKFSFPITACGKSLHGWNMHAPKNTTTNEDEVTCKRCIKKMKG